MSAEISTSYETQLAPSLQQNEDDAGVVVSLGVIHMAVTVVIGAQYGGEGKGKIVSYLSIRDNPQCVVRCGGPNSGHTVYKGSKVFRLRLLPAGFVNPRTRLLLAAGSIINPRILFEEMEAANVDRHRLGIDHNALIITDSEAQSEAQLGLRDRLGSTQSGTGIGVAKRALREESVRIARDIPQLKPYLADVAAEVNSAVDNDKLCIIEGTQGFGLSLYHSLCYPYATSRDTVASAFLSEVGVSPLAVTSIIMAVRTFPIRVEGNSGPLKNEISWQELRRRSGYPHDICEFTTVTGRRRRVASFDIDLVKRAAIVNRPTQVALHGADYLDFANKGITQYKFLTTKTKGFVQSLERELSVPVTLIGTGPEQSELIDRTLQFQGPTVCLAAQEGRSG
jgi:adenylosuccinate synthase